MSIIPKLIFKPMSLEENIQTIKWAYFEDNDLLSVHDYTIQYFTELSNIENNLTKEEIYIKIESVVTEKYNKEKNKLEEESKRYSEIWNKYNDIYFNMLSSYLDIDWPNNHNIIQAKVGFIPVFPRYLEEFCFSTSPYVDEWKVIETCAHETLHFIWFEKWKKIHPETKEIEFNSPYLVWQYSEMVTDPILNNKPFNDLFNFKELGYDSFYEMYDGDTSVMDNLRLLYSKNINIEDKINRGFDYIKALNN